MHTNYSLHNYFLIAPTKVYSLDDMRKKASINQDDIITMIHNKGNK